MLIPIAPNKKEVLRKENESLADFTNNIIAVINSSDLSVSDFFMSTEISNASVNDVVTIYADTYKIIENANVVRHHSKVGIEINGQERRFPLFTERRA